MPKSEITPGRRLRLDRRKALLDQAGLAKLLGATTEEVSAMENNKAPLTEAALAFIANKPAPVPRRRPPTPEPPVLAPEGESGLEEVPAKPPLPAGPPEPPEAPRAGRDKKPGATVQPVPTKPRKEEIKVLEAELLRLFAGENFLVPRELPDGTTIQVEAAIPGIAQFVGMLDSFDGEIVAIYAPGMARAWAQLAEENPTVRKWLNWMTYGGAYRGVVAATMPAVVAIAMHHGVGPGMGRPQRDVVQPVREDTQQYPPPEEGYVPEHPPASTSAFTSREQIDNLEASGIISVEQAAIARQRIQG